jgi:N-acetylglutamate synthase-like GNAT family acetyltransferase
LTDPVKIRPARRGDREAIASIFKELGCPDAADSNTVFWVINHPEIDLFVAVDHLDRPIGFVSLSHRPQLRLRGRITTIDELVVASAWRGKGVGSKLVATAIDRAKALSARRVELLAPSAGVRPTFFERNGFVRGEVAVMLLGELETR